MAIYVKTNVSSLNGRNKLSNVTNELNTTYQRLSSGLRINSAKDDAAGLQISDRLTTQINGLTQGNRNANEAIAFAQIAEGALDESINMLQRIRTLAVQSGTGTVTNADREAIQAEVTQLSHEIVEITNKTMYNEIPMLSGNTGDNYINGIEGYRFQIGANSGDVVDITHLSTAATIDQAAADLVTKKVITDKQRKDFLTQATVVDVSKMSKIGNTLEVLDHVIGWFDARRAQFGTFQNRVESTIRNQSNIIANTADARSRIRDADFAEESASLTQQNIIQQAASSMLMQANMRPQIAMSLIS